MGVGEPSRSHRRHWSPFRRRTLCHARRCGEVRGAPPRRRPRGRISSVAPSGEYTAAAYRGIVRPTRTAADWAVIVSQPPYALEPTPFRFPALASLAGRAPLGGEREIALATYLAARLAHDALAEREIAQEIRAERAANAKTWLSTLALPPSTRAALAALMDASGTSGNGVAPAIRGVLEATTNRLDRASRTELERLAQTFELPGSS